MLYNDDGIDVIELLSISKTLRFTRLSISLGIFVRWLWLKPNTLRLVIVIISFGIRLKLLPYNCKYLRLLSVNCNILPYDDDNDVLSCELNDIFIAMIDL